MESIAWAASMGHTDSIRALLAAGAQPGLADKYGCTPLQLAIQAREWNSAHSLLTAGACIPPSCLRGLAGAFLEDCLTSSTALDQAPPSAISSSLPATLAMRTSTFIVGMMVQHYRPTASGLRLGQQQRLPLTASLLQHLLRQEVQLSVDAQLVREAAGPLVLKLDSIQCWTEDAITGPDGFGSFPVSISLTAWPVASSPERTASPAVGTVNSTYEAVVTLGGATRTGLVLAKVRSSLSWW